MSKLKILTILGTRPEIIRLSRVMASLEKHTNHVLVHTGQNYDFELSEIFFNDLGVKKPDYFLNVDTSTLGNTVGGILIEVEKVLEIEMPDAVLILGDTNSAVSAYMARRRKIPIYHMEAGNRCFDLNVPEETNRRMVDHLSDFNLVYTEHGRRNLLSEGLHPRRIYKTGSPMREVLEFYRASIEGSNILDRLSLKEREYFLVSLHREENVDNPKVLKEIVRAISDISIARQMPMVVSTHPRTRKRIEEHNIAVDGDVIWMKPFGFYDYNNLQMNSACVISDSGTIAEESSILDFPAVTPRVSIERPEAQDSGAIIACGTEPDAIKAAVGLVLDLHSDVKPNLAMSPSQVPDDYKISNTADRVTKLIIGTARLSNSWDGIVSHDDKSGS